MCVLAAESGEAYGFAVNGKHMIIYGSHDVFHLRKNRAETGYDHVAVTVVGERFAGCKRAFDACTECRINRAVTGLWLTEWTKVTANSVPSGAEKLR